MYEFKEGDYLRVERSPYINGHFYLRLKKKNVSIDTKTIGFGYDEPYREESPFLSNPLTVSIRMFNAISEPISNKWVIYHNDYPRNLKFLPNIYHIVTNWFKMSDKTAQQLNNIFKKQEISIFKKPFSPISTKESNNCRSILMEFLKHSLTHNGTNALNDYLSGNPLIKDNIYGNVVFEIKENGEINITSSHPCGLSFPKICCNNVLKPKELAYREEYEIL